jgi:hypothetical protein
MSTDRSDATRRIMDSLGEQRRLPVVNVAEGDAAVLLGAPLAGLFGASLLGADALVLPGLLAGLFVGTALVAAAPPHRPAGAWLTDVLRYTLARPRRTLLATADSDHATTDGGLVQYTPFTPEESTQELTGIDRAWPGAGAIERRDGAIEGFLRISPANMDFAMSGDWQQVQAAAAEFANTELDFPLTVHATTRSFPAAQLVAQLDDRLDDADGDATPTLETLLEEYRDQRPADLADTQQIHYYLGVTVYPQAVRQRRQAEDTPAERLAEVPVVGALLTPLIDRQAGLDTEERQAAMLDRLDERLRTVRSELVEDLAGWSATRCSTLGLFALGAAFWTGTAHDDDSAATLVREQGALGAARREEAGGGEST